MSNILDLKGVKFFAIIVLAVALLATFGVVAVQKASADCSITTTLRVGSRGVEVSCLQSIVGATADGSFGPLTKAAVMAWQAGHGLVADGVVGPMTRAALMANGGVSGNFPAGCQSASGYSTTTGMPCNSSNSNTFPAGCTSASGYSPTTGVKCDSGSSSNSGSLSGGETSIDNVKVDDADDTDVDEGGSKVAVADISFDVNDADAELVRADVSFQAENNADEPKPWQVFDKVYLMDGSTVLASMSSDNSDDWDDSDDQTVFSGASEDAYRIRFNNVNKIYKEDADADLWVAVDVASSVDGADVGADWHVGVDTDGLRFTDQAGLDTLVDPTDNDNATFTIQESGAQSDLTITQDTSSPDAGTLEVDETSSTTETVAVFKVKADADGGDVKFVDFPVTLAIGSTTTGDNLDEVVDDVFIVVDGTTYSTDDAVGTSASQTFGFSDIEDDDVTISAGDSTKVTVKVKFKSQGASAANYANGSTVLATSAADENDFEDADTGDDINDASGTPAGETMQLFSEGVSVTDFSSTADSNEDNNGDTTLVSYDISFKVTAFGNTFYIPKTLAVGVTSATAGLAYTVEASSGSADTSMGTASTASQLTSSADTVSSYFEVPEGETVTFHSTINVVLGSGDTAGFYRAQLNNLGYDTNQTGNVSELQLLPAQDYETSQESIEA